MKKAKLEEYLGKQVKITLFNKDIITGVLHKTGEEQGPQFIYTTQLLFLYK